MNRGAHIAALEKRAELGDREAAFELVRELRRINARGARLRKALHYLGFHRPQSNLETCALIPECVERFVLTDNYTALPEVMQSFRNLKELKLIDNGLERWPEHLGESHPRLETLLIQGTQSQSFFREASFEGLGELRTMIIQGATELRWLPSCAPLDKLETLQLYHTGLRYLPQDFEDLPRLQKLVLRYNHKLNLPPQPPSWLPSLKVCDVTFRWGERHPTWSLARSW